MIEREFGRVVKEARRRLQLSQLDVSERCGISRATMIAIERGKANPGLKQVFKMAGLLKLDLTSLIETPALDGIALKQTKLQKQIEELQERLKAL